MRAGAERLTDGKVEHGDKEMPVDPAETEHGKGNDVADEGQNHTEAAAAEQVGKCSTGDFHEIDGKLAESDKETYLGEG